MSSQSWDYIMKFVIVGEASTGKTSILTQLTEQRFLKTSEPTIGVEFGSKLIRIAPEDDTQAQAVVKTQIWDVAGTPSFRSITAGYYRGAAGALLVYDVTSKRSFTEVPSWLADLRLHADPSVVIILVGNKADLVESSPTSDDSPSSTSASDSPPQDSTSSSAPSSLTSATSDPNREVSRQEAQEFARREGLLFLETSAKTGQGINEAFDQTARQILAKIQKGLLELKRPSGGIRLTSSSNGTGEGSSAASGAKGGCC